MPSVDTASMADVPSKGRQWRDDGEQDSPLYQTVEFRLYCLKVLPCSKRYCHDWTVCPFAHPGEKAKRRDPRVYTYTGVACPDMKKGGTCQRGEACPYAHSVFEYWLHPTRYRTQLCNDGTNCKRKVCFFAHSIDELRVPSARQGGAGVGAAPEAALAPPPAGMGAAAGAGGFAPTELGACASAFATEQQQQALYNGVVAAAVQLHQRQAHVQTQQQQQQQLMQSPVTPLGAGDTSDMGSSGTASPNTRSSSGGYVGLAESGSGVAADADAVSDRLGQLQLRQQADQGSLDVLAMLMANKQLPTLAQQAAAQQAAAEARSRLQHMHSMPAALGHDGMANELNAACIDGASARRCLSIEVPMGSPAPRVSVNSSPLAQHQQQQLQMQALVGGYGSSSTFGSAFNSPLAQHAAAMQQQQLQHQQQRTSCGMEVLQHIATAISPCTSGRSSFDVPSPAFGGFMPSMQPPLQIQSQAQSLPANLVGVDIDALLSGMMALSAPVTPATAAAAGLAMPGMAGGMRHSGFF